MCIEGIRKLRAANSHSFQRLKDIRENLFLQGSVVYPSPVDKNVEVSQVPVAELESVAFEQTFLGPLLGIGEADVNLANASIRKGGKDLVLELVSLFFCNGTSFSNVLWTDQICEQAAHTMIIALSHVHQRVVVGGEDVERIVFRGKTLSASKEVFMPGQEIVHVTS